MQSENVFILLCYQDRPMRVVKTYRVGKTLVSFGGNRPHGVAWSAGAVRINSEVIVSASDGQASSSTDVGVQFIPEPQLSGDLGAGSEGQTELWFHHTGRHLDTCSWVTEFFKDLSVFGLTWTFPYPSPPWKHKKCPKTRRKKNK